MYLEILVDNQSYAAVVIRRLLATPVFLYEVTRDHHPPTRGHVEHPGTEDLALLAAVLVDYSKTHTPIPLAPSTPSPTPIPDIPAHSPPPSPIEQLK